MRAVSFHPNRSRALHLPVAVALALGLGACAQAAPPSTPPSTPPTSTAPAEQTLQAVSSATVTLAVLREGLWGERTVTEEGMGSGFVLGTGEGPLVVTAAHVVRGATEIVAIDPQGQRLPVDEVVSLDDSSDVAVLRVEGLSAAVGTLEIGPRPAIGERVVVVSSPLGLSTTVAFGTVSAYRPEAKALQLAAGVSPGSSGGLVADAAGRAIGVIRSKASTELGGENIALCTPISFVAQALEHRAPMALSARPDRQRMADVATHRLLTTRAQVFESYPAAASVTFPAGDRPLEHWCARASGADVVLAIRELGQEDPKAWRQGSGSACATVLGGQRVVVWVGTTKVGRKVELTISHQR